MKKTLKISALLAAILAVTGCATTADNADVPTTTDDQPVATADSTADTSAPTAKIKLSTNSNNEVIAKIYTTYNNNPEGSVKLQWHAPKGTGCYDTSFPITKYGETNDMTWASVQVKQGNNDCTGTWTANVVNGKNVIATDSITVK